MRFLISSLIFLFSVTSVSAAIDHDALRDLAYQGDIAGVEAAMHEAHQQSLSGEIPYGDLRWLVTVLSSTHPDLEDFRNQWLAAMPESPYAQATMSWFLYNRSFDMRGNAMPRDTPPQALRVFSQMLGEALSLMESAFTTAPDFIPASDGVIAMNKHVRFLRAWRRKIIIANVMATTPNFGSLIRASYLSNPNWGGPGPVLIADLCNRYSDQIPEYPDLTKEACIVSLWAANDQLEGNWSYAADVLDRDDHVVLRETRVQRALARNTEADRQFVMDYLRDTRFDTPWIKGTIWTAHRFSRISFTYVPNGYRAFLSELQDRLHQEVRAQLVHDPFNLYLLRVATWQHPSISRNDLINNNEYANFLMRIAVAQPLHLDNWTTAGTEQTHDMYADSLNTRDTASINAIAYSDHNVFMISNFLGAKLRQRRNFYEYQGKNFEGRTWPPEAAFQSEVECRIATLLRLYEHAAQTAPEHRNATDGFKINQNLEQVTAELKATRVCDHIWQAPIDALRFEPIEIDQRSLLTIPEDIFR